VPCRFIYTRTCSRPAAADETFALKVLKSGMDSYQIIARFEAERQALAITVHPNMVKMFKAGAT
jgi:hypothetical protein